MVESASSGSRFDEETSVRLSDHNDTHERGPSGRSIAPPPAAAPVLLEPATAPAAAPQELSVAAPKLAAPLPVVRKKRSLRRPILFGLLPIALVAGGYYYVTGGQVMSTDNAYVQARMIGLSTDVSGTVAEIPVHNNQAVKKGDVLFRLRPDSFRIALEGARAQLGTVRNQVLTLQATYKQSLAQIEQAKADLPFYETGFKRQKDLSASLVASKATYDSAEHDLTSARQRLTVAQAQAQSMLAQLGNDPDQTVEQNPFYLQGRSLVDNAQRDLDDTTVRAPFDGVVTNVDTLQVGAYLPASQQGFMLVSTNDVWVEASPKETELTWVKPGQTAIVTVDTYPGYQWEGAVDSINPASGASFSLLPAQNTSGNWVKVVQRIPMRVRIDGRDGKPPLRVGMSVTAEIETGHARGIPEGLKGFVGTVEDLFHRAQAYASQTLNRHNG